MHAKLLLAFFCVMFNMLQYYIFPYAIRNDITYGILKFIVYITNIRINVHGDVSALNKRGILIMSNHYDGIDVIIFRRLITDHFYTVVKAEVVGGAEDRNVMSRVMYCFRSIFLTTSGFIPYKRGDKEDGLLVKNTIVETLNNGNSLLLFPEGTTTKDGVPKAFKNGIFHLAIEHDLTILPVTLKYTKDIGWGEGESLDMLKWFDAEVDVYIHDLVDCSKEKSFLELKDAVFKTISAPMAKVEQSGEAHNHLTNDN